MEAIVAPPAAGGLLSRIAAWWSGGPPADETPVGCRHPAPSRSRYRSDGERGRLTPAHTGVVLLALYEAVHANPNAITSLAGPPAAPPPPPAAAAPARRGGRVIPAARPPAAVPAVGGAQCPARADWRD
jgi:hypothetical protein